MHPHARRFAAANKDSRRQPIEIRVGARGGGRARGPRAKREGSAPETDLRRQSERARAMVPEEGVEPTRRVTGGRF